MPILCRVTRGELTESIHVVFAVAVDESGKIYSTGDPYYHTCIRSSLKPFQAAAAIKAGAVDAAGFSDDEIALMCASHYGEPIHIKAAQSMLYKIGLTVNDYECGSHFPTDKDSRYGMIKQGSKAEPFHNNCSGKHAGMLALAKHLNHGIAGYIKKDHPVQKAIFKLVRDYTGMDKIPTEIDGCPAPTPFMPLENVAGLFQKLGPGEYDELSRAFNVMCAHPKMVGGTHHFDSIFIDAMAGRGITKIGGEAIRGITIKKPDGGCVGIALKVLDGNFRALPMATMKILEHLQLLSPDELKKLDKFRTKILLNHNQLEIGRIEAVVDA